MIETAMFTSPEGTGTQWRLVGLSADPKRRVPVKFDVAGGQILGSAVRWGSEEEVGLTEIRFDGLRLSFRLPGGFLPASAPVRSPVVSLTLKSDREFQGFLADDAGARLEPVTEVRLVRVADEVASL